MRGFVRLCRVWACRWIPLTSSQLLSKKKGPLGAIFFNESIQSPYWACRGSYAFESFTVHPPHQTHICAVVEQGW